jgi:coenzyme F420-dependent glucose-6-phosphate dehydrogenase
MADVKFGVLIGGTWPQGLPSGADLLDLARSAEDLGFDSIHSSDHIASPPSGPVPVVNCFTFLSAAAAVTKRVQLGTFPLSMPMHNPSIVGSAMLGLHHISDGRAIFCTASGFSYPGELEAVGVALSERPTRNSEGMDVISKLWAEDKVTFEGQFSKMTDLNMALKDAHKPIPTWVNGRHPSALHRAVSSGDAWAIPMVGPQEFGESQAKIVQYASEEGRDLGSGFHWIVEVGFNINSDPAKARQEAEIALEARPDKESTTGQPPTKELLNEAAAVGSAEDCASRIREYVDGGATWIIATPLCPYSGFKNQMAQFSKEVMPRFKVVKATA